MDWEIKNPDIIGDILRGCERNIKFANMILGVPYSENEISEIDERLDEDRK